MPHANPPALTVCDGHGEFVIPESEFVPKLVHELRLYKLAHEQAKTRLKPIIEAWEAGHKNLKAIAAHLGKEPISILSQYREAMRRNLIGYPEQPYG